MNQRKKLKSQWAVYVATFSLFISVSFAIIAPVFVPAEAFAQVPPYTKFLGNDANGRPMYGLETAPTTSATNFRSLIAIFQNIIDAVIPFLVGLAVMLIIYGIIGIFVMVSIWGLVNILVGTFGFGANNTPQVVTDTYGKAYDASGVEITDRAAVLAKKPTTVIDLI